MQPKSTGFIPVLVGIVVATAGCGGPPPPEPPRPCAGARLRVACPGEPTATLGSDYRHSWQTRQRAQVEVVRYDPAQGPPDTADIWVVPVADLPTFASQGRLRA